MASGLPMNLVVRSAKAPCRSPAAFRLSTAQQQSRLVPIVAGFEARNGFQGKGHCHAVIGRADAVFADAKGQGRRPTPEIPIDRVVLFFQRAIARLEAMLEAPGPIFAETIVEAAEDGVVSGVGPQGRIAAQIAMAERPTPGAVR